METATAAAMRTATFRPLCAFCVVQPSNQILTFQRQSSISLPLRDRTGDLQGIIAERQGALSSSLQSNLVIRASGKGFGKKNVVENAASSETKNTLSPSSPVSSSSRSPAKEDLPVKAQFRSEVDDDEESVPEVVTNRMLKRISLTVGLPLVLGLLLFPLFYYLKIVSKLDVPEWLPLVVSMVTFGTAGFGITYGVVSSSWDPAREGTFLGWKEAQVNWPLIWDKFQGDKKKK